MNPRVLELIKNPKNIQSEDLGLLKEEIHSFPYIQNIRALHLYGVHLYEKENYQKELSITAAYTTDKKILYQLINGKIQQEPKSEPVEEKQSLKIVEKPRYAYKEKGFPIKREETVPEKNEEEDKESCLLQTSEEVKHIFVNGERNRILFEGEENFLDEENTETIDLESTLESGTLVTQKKESIDNTKEEAQAEIEENAGEDFTPTAVIDEDVIISETEEEKVEEEENLSFEETESLVPTESIEENKAEESIEAEAIIESENISVSAPEEVQKESEAELSFHGTEAFLPDVKIQANNEEVTEVAEISQPNVNKHEEEMRRLIEEVEKKMKETKSAPQPETEEVIASEDHEISFAETQNFHFWSTNQDNPESEEIKSEPVQQEEIVENAKPVEVVAQEEIIEEKEEETPEVQTSWRPMSLESNMPDSLIKKPVEAIPPAKEELPVTESEKIETTKLIDKVEAKPEAANEDVVPVVEEISELVEDQPETKEDSKEIESKGTPKEEAPVMNVSFFGSDISSLSVEEAKKENKKSSVSEETIQEAAVESTPQSSIDSNVPGFINTWQSWLKIDRQEETIKEKVEIKEKAIEAFIENNPRISQLREESSYVVKEKNDDISHLMTETLANLYFEQKLYTKAIKAFEILIKKNPDKKEYFQTKIKDIKDFRSKN
ncbi:tetratricopeptide repeat protein [Chryseobacterium sp.]|uniref:tetratricopeptide repeat protein n=1 Tax=Chryseobacterium sp. TaxID=1871047 RepID=UPI002FC87F69